LLVGLQTLLVGGVVIGCLMAPRLVPALVGVRAIDDVGPALALFPPAWFASVLAAVPPVAWRAAPIVAALVAVTVLAFAPQSRAPLARRAGWMSFALAPLRALAARKWVRREERGAFDLVFDALPLEREFVLRTYPMIAIPLAMLFAGSRAGSDVTREGLIALLLFTPATYLPILLIHVPASASADARWILDGAPISRATIDNGALKAIALRFVLPLYVVLFALAWTQAGLGFALRLAPIGFLVSLLVLRKLYAVCVTDVPLSNEPSSIRADMDWTGPLFGLAIGLTVLAIVAFRFVTNAWIAAAACALLIWLEWQAARGDRADPRAASGTSA
jgi:hypothetical protein